MATVRSLGSHVLALTVPATPACSVRYAVAHVIGIAHDLNAQRFDVTDPDEWTARQVRERRDATIDDLEVDCDREAPRLEEGLRLMGYEVGSHFVNELLHHAADIHHAVGLEPIDDDEALAVGLDFYLDRCHQDLVAHVRGSLGVQAKDPPWDRWTLDAGSEVATLEATRYELFRVARPGPILTSRFLGVRPAGLSVSLESRLMVRLSWTGEFAQASYTFDLTQPYRPRGASTTRLTIATAGLMP